MDLSLSPSVPPTLSALTAPGYDPASPAVRSAEVRQAQAQQQADEVALLGPSSVLSGSLQAALLETPALPGLAPAGLGPSGAASGTLQPGLQAAELLDTGLMDSTLLGSVALPGSLLGSSATPWQDGALSAALLESLTALPTDPAQASGNTASDPALRPPASGLGTQVDTYA